jgi:hypothetical protein
MNGSRFTRGMLLVLVLCLCGAPALAGMNQSAIDQVRAGKIQVAKASWWGFDPEDSTRALQAAINSGARRLLVENMGRPWIVTPLQLASNQTIVFEKGAEVLAKQGAFLGTGDCLFSANGKENVTLSGYGAVLRMRRSDYDQAPYRRAEWRHALQFKSCRNVRVYGLTLSESGGDGIYLGTGQRGVSNVNVHIKDVVCDKNYRQGISVITADGLLIENTIMRDTGGTAPMAGIDFEPNAPTERLCRVVMRHCTTRGNRGAGYAFYLPNLNGSSAPVSIRLEECKSIGDGLSGLALTTGNAPTAAVKGSLQFRDCVFERSGAPGIVITDKPSNGCRVRFDRCAVIDAATTSPQQSPIVLRASSRADEPIGGIQFNRCRVRDALGRRPMTYLDSAGGLDLRDIRGSLILETPNRRAPVALTRAVLGQWMPVAAMKSLPRLRLADFTIGPPPSPPAPSALSLGFARARGRLRAVLYAGEGEPVTLQIRSWQVGRYGGSTTPVVVTTPSGQEVTRAEVTFQAEAEVSFKAPETGAYHIAADPGSNSMTIAASSHSVSLTGDGQPVDLVSSQGELYFWVPAGTREFAVRVIGEGGEGIKAGLCSPSGKLVEEKDDIGTVHQFLVTLPAPSRGEVWSLRLAKASHAVLEDYHVDLRGLPPLLAPSREAVLRAERRVAPRR